MVRKKDFVSSEGEVERGRARERDEGEGRGVEEGGEGPVGTRHQQPGFGVRGLRRKSKNKNCYIY